MEEPIIIDGVNVKDCRRRIGKDNYCRYFKRLCSDNNFNCVWKQLARKTQECENLKAEEKYLKQCCQKAGEELSKHSFEYDGKEKNLVVQAMELNEKYEKLSILAQEESARNGRIEYELNDRLKQKTQECEELKRKLSNQEQLYQNEIEIYDKACLQLRQENDDLYLERLALNTANGGINSLLEIKEQENDRYRKALEEIENFRKKHCDFYCEHNRILDIINKAKGEDDER